MSAARPTVIAANWKMHKTAADVPGFFARLFDAAPPADGVRMLVFPPFPILADVVRETAGRDDVEVGAQTCHWEDSGAWTGEVSAPMIAATGAGHVLVGHSERRRHCGETDEVCARKIRAALDRRLSPMLCVGESLEEREAGRARAVVVQQLGRATEGLGAGELVRLSIAYEPVWAIGTGRTAAPDDAEEMHATIRDVLGSIATGDVAERAAILYGGSVKPANAAELLAEENVDGALVGGASLDPADFAAIATAGRG